jgi:hypothetical protein
MRIAASLRISLYGATVLLLASGLTWLVARYLSHARWLPAGLATTSMQIHGAASMAMLVFTGSAVALHAPAGWRDRKNRGSGIAVSAALIIITVTGYCLYYLGDDSARAIASFSHWLLGLAVLPLFLWHASRDRCENGRLL